MGKTSTFFVTPHSLQDGADVKNREQDGLLVKAGLFKFKVFLNDWLPFSLCRVEQGRNI
jgi:hypothetical protein